jgi:hypothetical protein
MTGPRVVSHGGGVQTTAMLVLAAQGKLDYQTFLFANVGDDSEHPGTLRYLREIAMPYAAEHGIEIHELHRRARDGSRTPTLYRQLMAGGAERNTLAIPAFLAPQRVPANRTCTNKYKITVIGRWLREHGATPASPATVAVGISADEVHRISARKRRPYERLHYPLVGVLDGEPVEPVGGRPLHRADCERIIRAAGLPVPGKSSCWFCPFQRVPSWRTLRTHEPELFAAAVDLERQLQRQPRKAGQQIYLHDSLVPLERAVGPEADMLPGLDTDPHCDNGWCMT